MQANEPQWWRPEYLGRPAAAEALTTIASPLFAGFSITLIAVIAQDSKEFALPGPTMLVLAVAAICFMTSLQCGFQARLYQTSPADVAAWNPGYDLDADQLRAEKSAQFTASMGYIAWELRSYFYYSIGLAALLAGLGLTLWPPPAAEQPLWRWVGVGLAAFALLFELFWSFGDDLWAKYPRAVRALGLESLFNAWYRPARRLRRKGRLPLPHDEVSADGQQEVPPGRLPLPGRRKRKKKTGPPVIIDPFSDQPTKTGNVILTNARIKKTPMTKAPVTKTPVTKAKVTKTQVTKAQVKKGHVTKARLQPKPKRQAR